MKRPADPQSEDNGDILDDLPDHYADRLASSTRDAWLVSGYVPASPSPVALARFERLEADLEPLRELYPDYQIAQTGVIVLSAYESGRMIEDLKNSMTLAILVIMVIIAITARSFLLATLSMVPNLLSLSIVAAALYLLGFGFQFTSVVALTVAFGIAVDNTVHFLHRYQLERLAQEPQDALAETMIKVGPVLIAATAVLALGIGVTQLSVFAHGGTVRPAMHCDLMHRAVCDTDAVACVDTECIEEQGSRIVRLNTDMTHDGRRRFQVLVRIGLWVSVAIAAILAMSWDQADADKADEAFLERLAGDWKGKGKLRPSATAKVEPVSCRMSASWDGSSSRSLSLSMKCRGVDVSFSSSGFLQTLKKNNAVEGRWNGTNGIGNTSVFGRRSGDALNLTLTSQDAKSGKTVTSSVSMRLTGGGRSLSNSVTSQDRDTGKNFQILSLSMKK